MQDNQERKRIGKMLSDLRKTNNMSQTELAEIIGMKQISISRIENGLFDMKVETVARILEVFGKRIEFADE